MSQGSSTSPNTIATSLLRLSAYLLLGVVIGIGIYAMPAYLAGKDSAAEKPQLRVGGSSVVYFIMDKWSQAFQKEKGVAIRYRSTGSADGVAQVIDGAYKIGFTSTPLTQEQRAQAGAKGGDLIQVPVVLIGVVPIYNLPELKDKPPLKFTGDLLAQIFLGKIDKWNHPDIQALNPDAKLPDLKITVVRREDPSGTTFNFANYLHGTSELWRKEMGEPHNKLAWPQKTVPMPRNHGVALFVRYSEGAIGYCELINAVSLELQIGAVQNKDKSDFLVASADTMTAAALAAFAENKAGIPSDLSSKPGKQSYPICAIDWAVCYKTLPAADFQAVTDFLHWATHDGQEFSKNLQYAPMPEEYRQYADSQLKTLKSR